jgi:hypothetical protein
MLHVLRRSGSPSALRRLVAFVLGVVLLAGCVEPLLADSCDGDAPRATAGAVLPHVDGAVVTAAGRSGPAVAYAVANVPARNSGMDVVTAVDAPDRRPGGDRTPEHAVHVCHCTHAHGGALSDRYALDTRTRPVARKVDSRSDRLPPSPALEPQLRPPALPHAA